MNIFKKSKWIDISFYEIQGKYYLIQMRYKLSNNKKEFRTVKIGFINDYSQKTSIFHRILSLS